MNDALLVLTDYMSSTTTQAVVLNKKQNENRCSTDGEMSNFVFFLSSALVTFSTILKVLTTFPLLFLIHIRSLILLTHIHHFLHFISFHSLLPFIFFFKTNVFSFHISFLSSFPTFPSLPHYLPFFLLLFCHFSFTYFPLQISLYCILHYCKKGKGEISSNCALIVQLNT